MSKSISLPKRTVAVGLALAVALWLTGAALLLPTASAETTEETIQSLLDQIAALQAQVAALTGGSMASCYSFTRDLTVGMSGADVTALQDYLTGTGNFTFSGGSTGYFGPITQAAVAAWQADNGVAPPAGYFGPISRAKYNSICTPGTSGGTSGSTALQGGEGYFRNFELLGDPSSETVYESDDQQVIGWHYEAQDSDLRTERVRVRFDGTANTEKKPWKSLEEVCLYHGSDEVDCESADSSSDWSEATSNIYEKTFAGLSEVTREGDDSEWYVGVMTPNSVDSALDGDTWTVSIQQDGVRAVDAAGVDVTGPSSAISETYTLDTAAQGKLELSLDSSENEDHVAQADDTNSTDNVTLLTWDMEAKDGSVDITDLAVDITSANSATGDVGDMVSSLTLYRDGSKIKTESVGSTATDTSITFDNIDQTQDEGTETWMVKGKVKNIDGSTFYQGDGLQLNIDNNDVTAEASNGDAITPTGGTITGGQVIFYTDGVQLAFVDASAVKSTDGSAGGVDDVGTFTIRFDVTAFGHDVYVPTGATNSAVSAGDSNGAGYTATVGNVSSTLAADLDSTANDGTNSTFKVDKDNTERFTMTVSVTAATGSTDFVTVALNSLGWATSDQSTSTDVYTFNLGDFKTAALSLTPR